MHITYIFNKPFIFFFLKKINFVFQKMSAETSKKASKTTIQSTLKFPILFTKDKKKEISTGNLNSKETRKVNIQQSLLGFLPADNFIKDTNTNKRKFEDIASSESENNEDKDTESDDDESSSSESEYELHDDLVIFPPNICEEEKKLRRNKFFLRLITPKEVRCQCGKIIKLDRAYRAKNLITHAKRSKCQKKTKKQISVLKYFSESSNKNSQNEVKTKACIGLTNEKIRQYVLKSPAEFGGSKSDFVIAKQLFPNKFPKNSKFSYSKLTSDECQQLKTTLRMNAKWIVEKETLSVRSTKCESFTTNIPQICNNCNKLSTNKRLLSTLDAV